MKGGPTLYPALHRPNWDEVASELRGLGADVVTTEERAREDTSEGERNGSSHQYWGSSHLWGLYGSVRVCGLILWGP